DSALLGELAADAAEELVTVDPAGRDLLPRRLHHAASLLVESPLLLRLRLERGHDRPAQRAGRLLLEQLPARETARGAAGDEVFPRVGEAHARMLIHCAPWTGTTPPSRESSTSSRRRKTTSRTSSRSGSPRSRSRGATARPAIRGSGARPGPPRAGAPAARSVSRS